MKIDRFENDRIYVEESTNVIFRSNDRKILRKLWRNRWRVLNEEKSFFFEKKSTWENEFYLWEDPVESIRSSTIVHRQNVWRTSWWCIATLEQTLLNLHFLNDRKKNSVRISMKKRFFTETITDEFLGVVQLKNKLFLFFSTRKTNDMNSIYVEIFC